LDPNQGFTKNPDKGIPRGSSSDVNIKTSRPLVRRNAGKFYTCSQATPPACDTPLPVAVHTTLSRRFYSFDDAMVKSKYVLYVENLSSATRSSDVKYVWPHN
jgi:hypothetical protein